MASSTDWTEVHVRLVNEAIDVWRPVRAQALSEHVFHLSSDPVPDDEHWAFQPGEEVVVEHRLSDGTDVLVAVARALDRDERSSQWLRKAG